MSKEYINRKIKNCQGLVDNAISEAQRIVYQGYLDLWSKKLPKKERPEEVAKREEIKAKKEAEEEAKAFQLKKQKEEAKLVKERMLTEEKAKKEAELKDEYEKKLKALETKVVEIVIDENTGVTEIFEEVSLAEIFELENPNKKAYRHQNGDKIKTIAFKEYLNLRTQ